MPKVEVLDVTKLVEREGFKCRECGHRHSGKTLAYICVGCSCEFVPDFDAIAAKQNLPDPPESK
jgi:DNA-directed RNA polymerase subunit RPC12/RpoP